MRAERQILAKFSKDKAGNLCQRESSILTFGRRLYDKMKRKKDKASEVTKTVRMDMRRLASLFITFRQDGHIHSSSVSE